MAPAMSRFLVAATIGAAAMTGVVSGQSFEQGKHGEIMLANERSALPSQDRIDHLIKTAEWCPRNGAKFVKCADETTTCVAVQYDMPDVMQPRVAGLCLPKERGMRKLCVTDSYKKGASILMGALQGEVPKCKKDEECVRGNLTGSHVHGIFYECKSKLPTLPTLPEKEKEDHVKVHEQMKEMEKHMHERIEEMDEQVKGVKEQVKGVKEIKHQVDEYMKGIKAREVHFSVKAKEWEKKIAGIEGDIKALMNNSEIQKLLAKSGQNEV